jgi:type VI protein secretion system component Hcp
MKTIAALTAAIAILAAPAFAAQKAGPNLQLLQNKPPLMAIAKAGRGKVRYLEIKLQEVFITSVSKPKVKSKSSLGDFHFTKKLDKASPVLF